MKRHTARPAAAVTALLATCVMAFAILVPSAGAQTTPAPGVSDKAIKLGYISSGSGVASSTGAHASEACKARIGRANAAGGVNGRKIEVEYRDDKSSANLDAARDLVENDKVFAVINNSALAFLSYRYLLDKGVPIVGGGYDGTYYMDSGNENIVSALGGGSVPGLGSDIVTKEMKKLGATKVASMGYSISPSSSLAAKAVNDYAAPAQGLKGVYLNNTIDFGTTDVAPIVLGIKNSGADATFLPLDEQTNIAIVQGLQQNGVQMKANLLATGYGPNLLGTPAAKTLTASDVIQSPFRPVELGGPAIKQFMADRKKYTGRTETPEFGEYVGYIACDMAVKGLEGAGASPTRQGFIDALRKPGDYDAAGLACGKYDLSYEHYGKIPSKSCVWFVGVKGDKFVVLNNGKPVYGKVVGDPGLIAQYAIGGASATTTTAGAASK